jgi:hypothetical protein
LQIVTARGITALDGSSRLFVPDPNGPDPVVARRPDGTCIFFNRDGRRLCIIHGVAGVEALPSACRHFPREILQDPRGTVISLSHFCPTAAALLLDSDSAHALTVVDAMPPLAIDGPIEGMDALASLPPLLRPGVLSDLAGYDAWERAGLATLARTDVTYRVALRAIAAATDTIRQWTPGNESLTEFVARTLDPDDGRSFRLLPSSDSGPANVGLAKSTQAEEAPLTANASWFRLLAARHFPASAAPLPEFDQVWSQLVIPSLPSLDHAIRNYLAARLFGNWVVYQGRGWRTVVAWVCTAAGVLENELARRCCSSGLPPTRDDFIAAVGATDLLLLHSLDSEHLASHFAPAEGPEPR